MDLFIKILKRIFCVLLCICAAGGGALLAKTYIEPLANVETESVKKVENGRINILLLATDKGGLLTDTIMLASIDTKRELINVMSVPRDTRVTIGSTQNNKINSVYAHAKEGQRVDAVIKKLNELTGLPINYYAVIHPDGFRNVIDILGGVYIDVPQRMKYSDPTQGLYIDLQPGYQLLDGDKAEQFTRFRSYPTGDLGRIEAQQLFITELFKQKFNANLLLKAGDIFAEIAENLETNFTVADVPLMLTAAKSFNRESIRTFEMPNTPRYINGASYVICDVDATKQLILKEFLGVSDENDTAVTVSDGNNDN